LQGKNIQSMFKSSLIPSQKFSVYYTDARSAFLPYFIDAAAGKKDVNTALREGEEAINKKVEALMSK